MLEVVLSTASAALLVWLGWWGRGKEEKWVKRVRDMVEQKDCREGREQPKKQESLDQRTT